MAQATGHKPHQIDSVIAFIRNTLQIYIKLYIIAKF